MSAGTAVRKFARSLRDATRQRRLRAPPVGSERFPLAPELEPLESPLGQRLATEAILDAALVNSVQRQEHPAFCAIASAMTVTGAVQVGTLDQWGFPDAFREASAWPPVWA